MPPLKLNSNTVKWNLHFCIWNLFQVRRSEKTIDLKDSKEQTVVKMVSSSQVPMPKGDDDILFFKLLSIAQRNNNPIVKFSSLKEFNKITKMNKSKQRLIPALKRLSSVAIFVKKYKGEQFFEAGFHLISYEYKVRSSIVIEFPRVLFNLSLDNSTFLFIKKLEKLSPLARKISILSNALRKEINNWDMDKFLERMGITPGMKYNVFKKLMKEIQKELYPMRMYIKINEDDRKISIKF